ncbi:hypothetical protein B0H14DRAFT_3899691 [Mycena olivaceomarginata]|nr:hypothetical protein B0H14DRAFT_3899691 [Mycena olivaceomarginata]
MQSRDLSASSGGGHQRDEVPAAVRQFVFEAVFQQDGSASSLGAQVPDLSASGGSGKNRRSKRRHGDSDNDDNDNDNEGKSDKNDEMTWHGWLHLSARSTRKPSLPVSAYGSPWLGPLVDRNKNTIYLHMLDPCDYSSDDDDPSLTRKSASAGALIKSLPSAMGYFAPEPVPQYWTNRIRRQRLSLSFDVCVSSNSKSYGVRSAASSVGFVRVRTLRSMPSIPVQLARYNCVLIHLDGGERRTAATFLV